MIYRYAAADHNNILLYYMAAECWLMVVDIIALLLFPLSGISQRITIYYARAYDVYAII